MHEAEAVRQSPETICATSEMVNEDAMSPESADIIEIDAEYLDYLVSRVASLESELAKRSVKLRTYRIWLDYGLSAYSLLLMLGPLLDLLDHGTLPDLRLSPYIWIIGVPYLWWLSVFLLGPLEGLYTPLKGTRVR